MANWSYYLGPWQWIVEDEQGYWSAPAGTAGLVDLRGLVDCALAGVDGDTPYGFFAVDPAESLGLDYLSLGQGDCRELQPSHLIRTAWGELTGHTPQGDTLVEWLWSQMTSGSDPTYDGPTPPLMPTVAGNIELHLGGHSRVKRERFDIRTHSHGAMVKDVLQRQFRRHFEAVDQGRMRDGQHRRILDFWCEKYRLNGARDWEQLVPSDLRRHVPGRLPHETVITESFDTANSSTLGPDLTWTEHLPTPSPGDFSVVSNGVRATADTDNTIDHNKAARADSALSGDDHYAQIAVAALASAAFKRISLGVIVRCNGSSFDNFYYGDIGNDFAVSEATIGKRVAGTYTELGTAGRTHALTETVLLEADGSNLDLRIDGGSEVSVTDTALTGDVYCGLFSYQSHFAGAADGDNFEAGDLAAGGATILPLMNHYLS